MKEINASEFKAKCLGMLDEVAEGGESILILKHGRPVAMLVPPVPVEDRLPQETLRGTVKILGDLLEPPLPPEAWEAEGDPSR